MLETPSTLGLFTRNNENASPPGPVLVGVVLGSDTWVLEPLKFPFIISAVTFPFTPLKLHLTALLSFLSPSIMSSFRNYPFLSYCSTYYKTKTY